MADNKQNTNPNVPNLSFKREQSEICSDSAERVINQKQNVPNLRFPEFKELWKDSNIGRCFDLYSGNTPSRMEKEHFIGDVNWITSGELKEHYIGDTKERISEKAAADNNLRILPIGTFVMAIYGLEAEGVRGTCSITVKTSTISQACMAFTPKSNVSNEFLYSWYKKHGNKIGIRYAQGTKQQNLSYDIIEKFPIIYPSIEEQGKLNTFISLLDERIATQNKIIEDLKKLKVAINQVCFEQKPIDEIPLHKFFKKGKAGGTPTSTNKEYYDGEIPFLSINDITEQGKYIYSTEKHLSEKGLLNSSAWVVPVNSLILSMYASVGLTTINKIPLATSQAMFSMELKEPELIDYLYYYLTYFKYRYIHRYLETGTQSNINADIVKSIKIPNYGKSKNIEMSAMLANIDKKIEIENNYLQSLLSQKAYLLSNMFI